MFNELRNRAERQPTPEEMWEDIRQQAEAQGHFDEQGNLKVRYENYNDAQMEYLQALQREKARLRKLDETRRVRDVGDARDMRGLERIVAEGDQVKKLIARRDALRQKLNIAKAQNRNPDAIADIQDDLAAAEENLRKAS